MWDVLRKLSCNLFLKLLIKHVRFCDCKHAVLDKKLRVVFAQLIEQHFITLTYVILVCCHHEKKDRVTLNMSEESHTDTLTLVCSFDDTRDVCHYK